MPFYLIYFYSYKLKSPSLLIYYKQQKSIYQNLKANVARRYPVTMDLP